MAATVEPYGNPQSTGEEVKIVFELFDVDNSGKVDREELKTVFKTLAGNWTEEKLEAMLNQFDQNEDGELTLVEFWSWINGHDGRSTEDYRPELLEKAISKDKERGAVEEARLAEFNKRKEAAAAKEAAKAGKEAERAAGLRISRDAFIKEKMEAGMSREVAMELYDKGDDDKDGDIDREELGWLVGDNLATLDQVKGMYQKGVARDAANVTVADCSDAGLAQLVTTFGRWDEDGDGSVNCDELEKVLKAVNPKFTQVMVDKMMAEIDTNKDGCIDVHEFVAWLSGENLKKKKMKKKAKEEQDAKIALALHRQRVEEAKDQKLLQDFMEVRHAELEDFCKKKKLKVVCGTLNSGTSECTACGGRHGFLCHGCGFVSFTDECVNSCSISSYGWSCISGKCPKKKCGCKKKPEIWQRSGFVGDMDKLTLDVPQMIKAAKEAAKAEEEAEAAP